jgi:carbonic anhydrase
MEHNIEVSPTEALARLKAGNERFARGKSEHPHLDGARRQTVLEGQHPFAIVISCSDSRVPVELIFDQGIGDVCVVRVAGNVCNGDVIASVECAIEYLGAPLCVVLGHTKCGAVTAMVKGKMLHGSLAQLVRKIRSAADDARRENPSLTGEALVDATAHYNVVRTLSDLAQQSIVISEKVSSGALKVAGGVYDLATGQVNWL